jgi:hypothetical protein
MATNLKDNEFLLRCSCGDRIEHTAWLIHEPDESRGNNLKGEDDDWYLMSGLELSFGFWRRLWVGFRYVFLPSSINYYGYAELVLRNEDVDALAAFIKRRRSS